MILSWLEKELYGLFFCSPYCLVWIKTHSHLLALPSSISRGLLTWNRRLVHVSYQSKIKMSSKNVVKGLDLANNVIPSVPCTGCAYGKHQRSPFPVGRTRATHTGQLVHSDLSGPIEKMTPNGSLYFVLFIDDYCGWRFINFSQVWIRSCKLL